MSRIPVRTVNPLRLPKPTLAKGGFDAATARALDLLPDPVVLCRIDDPDLRLIYVNPAFERVTGYSRAESVGKNCRHLQDHDRDQPELMILRDAIERRVEVSVMLRNYRKDGSMFWNKLQLAPLRDATGEPTYYIATLRDVTAVKESAVELRRAADYDRLTGCLNRDAMMDRLSELNSTGRPVIVIKADVASFNDYNNAYGYDVANTLLKQIAGRLRHVAPDAIGRISGNQFSVCFCLDRVEDGARRLAQVQDVLRPRYELPGATIDARFAIGFIIDTSRADGVTLARRAGVALAQSKASSLLGPREYDAKASARSRLKVQRTAELVQAVAEDAFVYHYQPKIDLSTGRVIGAEALLRWPSELGDVWLPDTFIDLAEETGLIRDINAAGFPRIAAFAAKLNRGRETPLNIAVNISAAAFLHGDLPDVLARALEAANFDPRWITLELTEGLMAESSPELLAVFGATREKGFGLSIDDFGTGYSSLRYLDSFPITEIKLDRSFVAGLAGEGPKRIIAEAVVRIGAALGINVVAEGIETEADAQVLRDLGCPTGQGYLFGRPMPADAFAALVGRG